MFSLLVLFVLFYYYAPFNDKKYLEGSFAGWLAAFIGATVVLLIRQSGSFGFIVLQTGFASLIAMIAEGIDIKIGLNKIDDNIKKLAPAWPIEQLAVADRNILRLAIFEILLDNKVPVKVVINEAVELAKTFGSDNSSRFVNGVLGSVSSLANR